MIELLKTLQNYLSLKSLDGKIIRQELRKKLSRLLEENNQGGSDDQR